MTAKTKTNTKLKDKIFAHIEASRPYTVIWCGLVSLAGACIAFKDFPPLTTAVLVTIIPMMGWTAGLYLTDFFDRRLDLIQKPHRPIPSGRIHKNEALAIGGIFATLGFLLSFLLGFYNVLIVFPVAVRSIIASASSGGLASVAPKERMILTWGFSPFLDQGVIISGTLS